MIVAALALASAPLAPLRPGIWGDVTYSRRSDDHGGIELSIPAPDAKTIDLTICEGGCSTVFHPAIVRTSDGFRFDVDESIVDDKGKPTGLPARHCIARFEAGQLIVSWVGEGTIDRLHRLRRPHALRGPHETPVLER